MDDELARKLRQSAEHFVASRRHTLEEHEPYLLEIGRIVALNNRIESLFAAAISWVVSPGEVEEDIGHSLTAEMSYRAKREALVAVCKTVVSRHLRKPVWKHLAPRMDELLSLVSRADQREQRRNTLVHSTYSSSPLFGFSRAKVTAKRRRGLRWEHERLDVADLREETSQLLELLDDLTDFVNEAIIDPTDLWP